MKTTRLALPPLLVLLLLLLATPAAALEVIVGLPYGTSRIGHTAVRVDGPDGPVIYDYGRYGKVWGPLRMQGEGVMRVWRGEAAVARYFAKQQSYRDSIGYVITTTPAEERAIYDWYEKQLEDVRWTKEYPQHTRYRLAQDYDGVLRQCTSISLMGLKAVWPKERVEAMLPLRFNKGQGFNPKVHDYYFATQKKAGVHEVVVPLDLIDAFEWSMTQPDTPVSKRVEYPRR